MFFEKCPRYLLLAILLFSCGSFFVLSQVFSAEDGQVLAPEKILISEVSLGGETARDEFVELYNPNAHAVDLSGWSLKKKSKDVGSEYANLSSDLGVVRDAFSGKRVEGSAALLIPARGYLLIVPRTVCGESGEEKCYLGTMEPDGYYSVKDNSLAADNSLALFDAMKNEVDQVGWGMAADFEGAPFVGEIVAGKSLARKTVSGVMEDTGDNSRDFFVLDIPQPQDSKSFMGITAGDKDPSGETEVDSEEETETVPEGGIAPAQVPASSVGVGKDVIITELLANPAGEDSKLEFIEIYNAGTIAADIGNWALEDVEGKTGVYIFPAGTEIAGGKYLALFSGTTKLSLNNDGDGAVLKNASGTLISRAPSSGTAEEGMSFAFADGIWSWTTVPTPGEENILTSPGKGMESPSAQIADGVLSEEDTDKGTDVSALTVDEEEGLVSGSADFDFADGLTINEILPDPAGRDNRDGNSEWVEIYNENRRGVNLKGWCLDDILDKGSKPFCVAEDRIIAAGGYLIFRSDETKITFNNTEDEVSLLWPDKRVVDSVAYAKTREGYSYGLLGGKWIWTAVPTPGKANIQVKDGGSVAATIARNVLTGSSGSADEESGTVLGLSSTTRADDHSQDNGAMAIDQLKSLPDGSSACLSALVSSPPGNLGKDIFYAVDAESGAGIQILVPSGETSRLALGDEIRICGTLSEVGGERRFLSESGSLEKLSSDNALAAEAIDMDSLDSQLGSLVSAEGTIVRIESENIIFLDLAGSELKIYAEPETGISFDVYEAGDRLSVTGILSRTSVGFRLLPRFASDIRSLESRTDDGIMVASGKDANPAIGSIAQIQILLVLAFGALLIDWMRMRIRLQKTAGIYLPRGRDDNHRSPIWSVDKSDKG